MSQISEEDARACEEEAGAGEESLVDATMIGTGAVDANGRLAAIVASLNALRAAVEELQGSTIESRRDVDGLRCRISAEAGWVDTRTQIEAPMAGGADRGMGIAASETGKLYELPTFSGNTEDWPLFFANFKDTTDAFRYSERQNLMRLRKCLTGEAKEAVASMLIFPRDVSKVIDELEFRFGRPDLLLRQQIAKIQQFPNIGESRLDQVMHFSTKVRNIVAFVTSANCQHHLANTTLLEQLVQKLPPSKQLEWIRHSITIKPFATIKEFSEWLSEFARIVCLMPPVVRAPPAVRSQHPAPLQQQPRRVMHVNDSASQEPAQQSTGALKCYECGGAHRLADCDIFGRTLSVPARWEKVKSLRLCFTCLSKGHNTLNCRSRKRCEVNNCRRYHHRSLHDSAQMSTVANLVETSPAENVQTMLSCQTNQPSGRLFKVLPISLYGPNGKIDTFAMFDEGSAISLLDEHVGNELGLVGQSQPLTLQWYGQKRTTEPSAKVNLEIKGLDESTRYSIKNVRTIPRLNLPLQSLQKSKFAHFESLPLKDYVKVKPVMLIGLDNAYLGVPAKVVEADDASPVAIKTKLGWVAYGPAELLTPSAPVVLHIREEDPLLQVVTEFFAADNFGINNSIELLESEENIEARRILEEKTRRVGKRFECGLLWKSPPNELPHSFEMAVRRLLNIERKMHSNPDFAAKYRLEMQKYVTKNYARELAEDEVSNQTHPIWYLPHFAVQNPQKPDKMRVVFDAAAMVDGTSLNSKLMKGPEQAKPLLGILFRFREGAIGVAADICEMFSQIRIVPSDQQAQRFVWRDGNANLPIRHYVMTSLIFGAVCSPCCAEFIKNRNADEFKQEFPAAAAAIIEKHYVDDFVASFNNEEEAKEICEQIVHIHAQAGFNLRKFISNCPSLRNLNADPPQNTTANMECQAGSEKVLGMVWDTMTDTFQFKCKFHRIPKTVLNSERPPTKRELLGIVMSVFDPFGFLADFLLYSKALVQETWKSKIAWDDPLPAEICQKWYVWWNAFKKAEEFKVQRQYSPNLSVASSVELHVVVDASQVAFAAAAYIRVEHVGGCDVALVAGKTRGAPQRVMSIPRLELQAAVLGTRLSKLILRSSDVNFTRVIFWSDSQTLLHWIYSTERRYKAFVGHRIAEILATTKPSQWRWVPTNRNTADVATRPKWPPKFNTQSPWLTGPEFLRQPERFWPTQLMSLPEHLEEEIKPCLLLQPELKRVMAWVFRAIDAFRRLPATKNTAVGENVPLSIAEIRRAENYICQSVQHERYASEISHLNNGKAVPRSSPIYKLSPGLGDGGLLRVQGRIDNTPALPLQARRPILLPRDHAVSELIMRHYHERFHHQNKAVIINEVRQTFWFPHAKSLLKTVESRCMRCKIDRARPKPPLMGQLPPDRLTPYVRPFTYTGVDLFGPLNVTIGRRREKRWGVIFTCLTTRAAHLELAENLSTDAFILCLRNFVNRRGTPVRIRSDNGTNFIGAQKELNSAEHILDVERISNEATKHGIEWTFNCPLNPSSGGCWERLIGIVKRLLLKTLHCEAPRVETLRSLLIEAENIINSRPLTDIPLSTEEDEPLTPNHFLIGAVNSTQTPQPPDEEICVKKQWRISQNLKDRLWKRWIKEYLPQLLLRTKWHGKATPLKVDDFVLICDASQARSQWRKGRITKVFPAKDGQIRFAEVRTAAGSLRRPATRLAVLNMEGESRRDSRGEEC